MHLLPMFLSTLFTMVKRWTQLRQVEFLKYINPALASSYLAWVEQERATEHLASNCRFGRLGVPLTFDGCSEKVVLPREANFELT